MDKSVKEDDLGKEKLSSGSSGKETNDLTKDAYNDIRRMIFFNELLPGQKVAYRALAGNLGMSLTPVVQALKHMEFLGFVKHVPNRGFYIETLSREEVEEIYDLREVLEVSLMPKVVARIDAKGEQELKRALDGYLEASRTRVLKQRLAKDMNFHITLAAISGQKIYLRVLKYLLDFLYLRFGQELIFSRPWDKVDSDHQDIYDFIIARDVKGACDTMASHIRHVRDNALEGLQDRLMQMKEFDF